MSSRKEEAVEGFSLARVKEEPPDSYEEGAGVHQSQVFPQVATTRGTQSSTSQNAVTRMTLVTIKQELPGSSVAGPSSNSGARGLDPLTLLTLAAIKQEPEVRLGLGCLLSAIKQEGSGRRVAPAPPKLQRIGDSDYFSDPVLGLVKENDPFNLDLSMSLGDAKTLNFQFDELTSILKSTPGFEETSEFDLMRKDPLAAFNLPSVTVEKVLQLMETDMASGRLEHIKSNWWRVVIGTYRFGKPSAAPSFPTDCIVSRYGLSFSARHTNLYPRHPVKVCIPITEITNFRIYNGPKICVMGIQTGIAYAAWLRSVLGFEHDPKVVELRKANQVPSCFYDPLVGGEEHKWIILMVETLSEGDYSKLKTFFLQTNGKDFVCNFLVMNNSDAKKFVDRYQVYE